MLKTKSLFKCMINILGVGCLTIKNYCSEGVCYEKYVLHIVGIIGFAGFGW